MSSRNICECGKMEARNSFEIVSDKKIPKRRNSKWTEMESITCVLQDLSTVEAREPAK